MRAAPFILAISVAAGLILSAPFVGQARALIRQTFPGHFVLVVGSIVAAGLTVALLAAVLRIRERRAKRYGAIALAILIAAAYAIRNAGDNPESNVVELFHFLQYGLISLLFYRAWRPLGDLSVVLLTALSGLMVGTVEEWLQWFVPNRVGEMKDVLLNLVAIGCGLLFSLAVDPPERRLTALPAASRRRVAVMASAAVLVFAAFFHIVHLGYRVDDPEIGSFVTRYSSEQLLGVQRHRTTEWAAAPPPVVLVRLSREDQYLTEGIQHVRWRNKLWEAGDVRGSWLENRILEKYYEPVLNTPTHEGAGHRWPPAQRADAVSRASNASTPEPYVSAAYPYTIHTWPKGLFWTAVGVFATVLLILTRRRRPLDQSINRSADLTIGRISD
ncbi:MAG TPA: VanZ family protein [Vicinamibacterales bacterium]|nr:VanZ family protein [Vicinamibacterales bacterium]